METSLAESMAPDGWNTAPPRSTWAALTHPCLPAPFFATVCEGTPILPPPRGIVWFAASAPRLNAWWALPLPETGHRMRVFEWAPLASRSALVIRARWWCDAVAASQDSVIWAVVPEGLAQVALHTAQTTDVRCFLSGPFQARAIKPQVSTGRTFWDQDSGRAYRVGARCLLMVSERAPQKTRVAWANVAQKLPELLLNGGQNVVRHRAPTPADWWWGLPRVALPEGAAMGKIPPNELLPMAGCRCTKDRLCQSTCDPILHTASFSRYLGNLGIPPTEVHSLLREGAPEALEGTRAPAPWMAKAWLGPDRLIRAGSRLG